MIYLIITASINNKHGILDYDIRKERYIDCITTTINLVKDLKQFKTIIVENNGSTDTYLNGLGCDVLYTNSNILNFEHKGVNELIDINQVIQQYNIHDDDIIIKLTGRYKLLNGLFFNLVIANATVYDAFVKFFNVCTLQYMQDDCVLGLFALKCKYIKTLIYKSIRSPECEFAEHVRSNVDANKLAEIEHLHLECCFADDHRILCV